jgi:hypothetical protein
MLTSKMFGAAYSRPGDASVAYGQMHFNLLTLLSCLALLLLFWVVSLASSHIWSFAWNRPNDKPNNGGRQLLRTLLPSDCNHIYLGPLLLSN